MSDCGARLQVMGYNVECNRSEEHFFDHSGVNKVTGLSVQWTWHDGMPLISDPTVPSGYAYLLREGDFKMEPIQPEGQMVTEPVSEIDRLNDQIDDMENTIQRLVKEAECYRHEAQEARQNEAKAHKGLAVVRSDLEREKGLRRAAVDEMLKATATEATFRKIVKSKSKIIKRMQKTIDELEARL
jgi:hypothetical protein